MDNLKFYAYAIMALFTGIYMGYSYKAYHDQECLFNKRDLKTKLEAEKNADDSKGFDVCLRFPPGWKKQIFGK